MNIQISDSWLREFLETKATPSQIAEYLSLCSQSVEKLIKDGEETVYDIEITTNRPDCLSVYGIGRELSAILPRFEIKAKLKEVPTAKIPKIITGLPLQVKISKTELCPRFTALIFDNITIKPSPSFVQKRLENSGIRALNNVIDISNYLMLELGQPMHTFDYDKILKHKMFLREAKEGEEIITLDGQKRALEEGIIIIEDGEGRIVDLCGIMGAKNSETDENTKRVLLFIQTYDPMRIRRACQVLGFHTEAAARFEKGIDPEGVSLAMERATLLFKEWCGGKVGSKLIDIYPSPPKTKSISVTKTKIDNLMGTDIKLTEAKEFLDNLGFKTKIDAKKTSLVSTVPHWRNADIDISEDIIEEIARVYGYHNLPDILPPLTTLNFQKDDRFEWENKIKTALKYWGFTETVNYSMVGKNLIHNPADHLKISNPLIEDLLYLRTSLIPSLLEVIGKNPAEEETNIFELANIYLPGGKDELPLEIMTLTLAVAGESKYLKIKGVLEVLLKELGIEKFTIQPEEFPNLNHGAKILVGETNIGIMGEVVPSELTRFNINQKVTILNIQLERLIPFAAPVKKFTPLPKYPPIIEDLSFIFPPETYIGPVIEEIKKTTDLIKSVELLDTYQDTKTFRITYQSSKRNLTDREIKKPREKIISFLAAKFQTQVKGAFENQGSKF